ncbi:MAG: hypothetical protein N2D54_12980, partial [Chloroflexota bacterium]
TPPPDPVCQVPGSLALIQPSTEVALHTRNPLFEWNAASNAGWYEIQLSTDDSFSSSLENFHLQNTYWLPSASLDYGSYYWRVRGENWGNGCNEDGTWSTAYELVLTPPPNIFADGFESADLTAWEKRIGKIVVKENAAIKETYGAKVRILSEKPRYLIDDSPNNEVEYHARFHIDLKNIVMNHKDKIRVFQGHMGFKQPFYLLIRKWNTNNSVRAFVRKDDGSFSRTKWLLLPVGSNAIEIDWQAAQDEFTNNGSFTLYLNGLQKAVLSDLDNDKLAITQVRLGITRKIPLAFQISGYFFLDHFASDSQQYLGTK